MVRVLDLHPAATATRQDKEDNPHEADDNLHSVGHEDKLCH